MAWTNAPKQRKTAVTIVRELTDLLGGDAISTTVGWSASFLVKTAGSGLWRSGARFPFDRVKKRHILALKLQRTIDSDCTFRFWHPSLGFDHQ